MVSSRKATEGLVQQGFCVRRGKRLHMKVFSKFEVSAS